MAKVTKVLPLKKKNIKRKGVHAKTKQSSCKTSKNYAKPYRGQGR